MNKTLLLSTALLLSACGSSPHRVVAIKSGDDYYKPDRAAAMAIDQGSGEKIVCKRRAVTGSHMKKKFCTTQLELDQNRADAKANLDDNRVLMNRKLMESRK